MRCGTIREALSARLDGENPGLPDDDIDAHLGGCESCRALGPGRGCAGPGRRARAPRPGSARPCAPRQPHRPADEAATGLLRTREWRVVLALLTVVQMIVAWPGVLLHDGHASVHLAHELTAWDIGLAVGFLVAALRPARPVA